MKRTLVFMLLSLFVLTACQGDKKQAEQFRTELDEISVSFTAQAEDARSRSDYNAAVEARDLAVRELLDRNAALHGDETELVRVQAALMVKDLETAEQKIEALLQSGSTLENRVVVEKVNLLIAKENMEEAVPLFKTIEDGLTVSDSVMEIWLNLAFSAPDAADREAYGKQFLAAENRPAALNRYASYVVQSLAFAKKDAGDLDGARQMLTDAIASETDDRAKQGLASELKVLEMIGQPAIALEAPEWMNSTELKLEELKGKVVLIDFWATWCPPCRQVIPSLVEAYNELKEQGLVVIGYTKLYGSYRDDVKNEGKVEPARELALTREFLKRFNISYPVAVADNDEGFTAYGVRSIPTLYFIDRNGIIVDAEKGSESAATLKTRIEELLAR